VRDIQIQCTFTRNHTVVCSDGDVYSRLVVFAYVGTRSPNCRYVALDDVDNCLLQSSDRLWCVTV
jgi:hypothetical protein